MQVRCINRDSLPRCPRGLPGCATPAPRPARGALRRTNTTTRPRCAAPSHEPAPPSLQSIQDAAAAPSGHVSPMLSLDWGEGAEGEEAGVGAMGEPHLLEPAFDVCGVGQCLIDVNMNVSREVLESLNIPHGGRRLISAEERDALLRQLEQVPSAMAGDQPSTLSMFNLNNVTPGGSLLNTLVGLSRLGAAASAGARPLRIAMAGLVGGDDRLGAYVRQQLRGAGVSVVKPGAGSLDGGSMDEGGSPGGAAAAAAPGGGAKTGTVMVFCTPSDAQRSFLSYIPDDDVIGLSPELLKAARRSRVLLVEGYLFDLPGADVALPLLVEEAKAAGAVVALTMGDAGVVRRCASTVAACIAAGADMLFANKGEALALTACAPVREMLVETEARRLEAERAQARAAGVPLSSTSFGSEDGDDAAPLPVARNAAEAADQLSRLAAMVVVTDGSRGSYVSALGATQVFPPRWSKTAPVDTCGAGDNYAAGLLYGLLSGLDLAQIGQIAAHTASRVIARHGPQLDPTDARRIVVAAARSVADAAMGGPLAASAAGGGGAGPHAGRSLMAVLEARALLAAEEAAEPANDAAGQA